LLAAPAAASSQRGGGPRATYKHKSHRDSRAHAGAAFFLLTFFLDSGLGFPNVGAASFAVMELTNLFSRGSELVRIDGWWNLFPPKT